MNKEKPKYLMKLWYVKYYVNPMKKEKFNQDYLMPNTNVILNQELNQNIPLLKNLKTKKLMKYLLLEISETIKKDSVPFLVPTMINNVKMIMKNSELALKKILYVKYIMKKYKLLTMKLNSIYKLSNNVGKNVN